MFMRAFFITTLTFNLVTCLLEGNIYAQDYAEVEWSREYLGPDSLNSTSKALEIDKWGNVYVAVDDVTASDLGWDFVIIKYNSKGDEEWAVRYSGVGEKTRDYVGKIAVDDMGNVYATGSSVVTNGSVSSRYFVTLKYNSEGSLQWTATEGATNFSTSIPVGLAVDDSGNVYVTCQTGEIFKYTSAGERLWSIPRDGRHNYTMALIDNSSLYIARSGAAAKYSSDGIKQWEARDTLEVRTLGVDSHVNVYVCGRIGLTKFSGDGVERWTALYPEGYFLVDFMTIDNASNPIVLGSYFDGTYPDDQHGMIKYDTNGMKLWEALLGDPTFDPLSELTANICADRLGNIYVVRYTTEHDSRSSVTTMKLSPVGESKWVIRYGDLPLVNGLVRPSIVVKVDSLGNVYVAGVTVFRENDEEVVIIKYRQPNFLTSVKQKNTSESTFYLFPNYPNPFNPSTTIKFSIQKPSHVQLEIINLQGQILRHLVDEEKVPGVYDIVWDGWTEEGSLAASGIYFCRLSVMTLYGRTRQYEATSKLLLLK
jgi:hypothetical protein